jgi:hypothetical protein
MCLTAPDNPRVLGNPLIVRSRSWGYLRDKPEFATQR